MTRQLITTLIGTLASAALQLYSGAAVAAAEYKIVTANEKGTYFAIGVDLAKFVAPDAEPEFRKRIAACLPEHHDAA